MRLTWTSDFFLHSRSKRCLKACAVDDESFRHLEKILQPIVESDEIVGSISPYLVKRFGFRADCNVVAGTGDNPSSLAGTQMKVRENLKVIEW